MATVPPSPTLADESHHPGVPVRVALLSILIFWLFYFAVVSVRWLAVGSGAQLEMLAPRSLVTLVCMGLSYLMYRALSVAPGMSFRRTIILAALLAVPASIIYSSVNWFAFSGIEARNFRKPSKTVVIRNDGGETPTVQVLPPTPNSAGAGVPPPPLPPAPPSTTTVIQVGGDRGHDDDHAIKAIAENSVNGYFFFVAWAAVFLALCYAAETQQAERRAARFRAAAQAAELRALRYQVNPHFLFNTLNSLSSLVMVDRREEAERMILNLSTFFRTSLTADPAEDLPLYEEIRLQRLYLDIERVRFPERLQVEIEIPDELRTACVPALILQPLVENAIKYGVSRSREPVTIRIRAREDSAGLLIVVSDDGRPVDGADLAATAAGTGLGLRNVRDRLAARFDSEGQCRWGPLPGGGFAVTLTMPVVRNGC
jgi:anti-sigma regulatory factor (Ser/Thr protein kinase)